MPQQGDIRREVLPIPDRKPVALTTYTANDPDTRFPPIHQLRPPAGAPNVLVVLLDDVGFGPPRRAGRRQRAGYGEGTLLSRPVHRPVQARFLPTSASGRRVTAPAVSCSPGPSGMGRSRGASPA